jgi:hypothetical protein
MNGLWNLRILSIPIVIAVVVVLATCSKKKTTNPLPVEDSTTISGHINPPSGSSIKPDKLEIVSSEDGSRGSTDGTFQIKTQKSEKQQIVLVRNYQTKKIQFLGYVSPDSMTNISISAVSTAEALVMLNPFLVFTTKTQREQVLERAKALSSFNELVHLIDSLLVNDPENVLDYEHHPEVYSQAARISVEALKSFGSYLGMPRATQVAGPYVIDKSGTKVAFVNPKLIYFAAGVYPEGTCNLASIVMIEPKPHYITVQLDWPPVYKTPPETTDYDLGNGNFNVEVTRGFHKSNTQELLNWDTPFGRATIANIGLVALRLCDLALGNVPDVPVTKLYLKGATSVAYVAEMYAALQKKDLYEAFTKSLSFIKDNIDEFSYWLWQENPKKYSAEYLREISDLLSKVTLVLDIVETFPFAYDLAFSPVTIGYYECQQSGNLTKNIENYPPDRATYPPGGVISGPVNQSLSYSAVTLDPEEDDISYRFDFGDGTISAWGGYMSEGISGTTEHTFSKAGKYYVSFQAKDVHGAYECWSESLEVNISGSDTTRPAPVTDLATSNPTSNSVTLTWTAPGDDSNTGTASQYDIRYSTSNITPSIWNSATQCGDEPTPKVAGSSESHTVTGLNLDTKYYFALKTADEVPNWSGLSNVAETTTVVVDSVLADSIVQLTDNPHLNESPSWSPDGLKIAFNSYRPGTFIYIMNPDGSGEQRVSDLTPAMQPDWSPDGSRLVFVAYGLTHYDIFVMNVDGSNPQNLTPGGEHGDWHPVWSPDGSRIAYTSYYGSGPGTGTGIRVMNADGSNNHALDGSDPSDGYPCWSPDGTMLAFTSNRDNNREIYISKLDGTGVRNLTNNPAMDDYPAWSPDGTKIAFISTRNQDHWWSIYVMDSDGSNPERITKWGTQDIEPDWSPDGHKIVFTSNRGPDCCEIYVAFLSFH